MLHNMRTFPYPLNRSSNMTRLCLHKFIAVCDLKFIKENFSIHQNHIWVPICAIDGNCSMAHNHVYIDWLHIKMYVQ